MGRAPCCDKSKVKRGPWSPEEDNILKNYVAKHGTAGSWIALPHKAGLKRCGKSCRLRWLNYLRPNIKHGGFTHEEDTIILTLFRTIGSRWSVIASQLAGRTDNDVKNYWNTKLKKKLLLTAPAGNSIITSANNQMDLITEYKSSWFDNSQELEMVVLPFSQHTASTPSTSSFCAEDDSFLVGWGSDELIPPHQLDSQEGPTAHHNFNFGYFDPPNISDTQTIYQSLAN